MHIIIPFLYCRLYLILYVNFDVIYVSHAPLLLKWTLLLTLLIEWFTVKEAHDLIVMKRTVSKAFVPVITYQCQACFCPFS